MFDIALAIKNLETIDNQANVAHGKMLSDISAQLNALADDAKKNGETAWAKRLSDSSKTIRSL